MTSLETQGFAQLDQPGSKGASETSGSRTWRLLVAAATLLAILAFGLLARPEGSGESADPTQASAQSERPMTGWGKWGGYTP